MLPIKPIIFTPSGLEKLKNDHEALLQKRKEVVERLSRAREMGDLSENAAYKGARLELTMTDSRLRQMLSLIKRAKVVEKKATDQIDIGSTIIISDGQKDRQFIITGSHESNPSEGKLSYLSPLGKSLMGKKEGQSISIETTRSSVLYTIKKVN